jgi:lysozyme
MKTSDAGIYALALHEGIVPAPYKDSVGVWTYGIGHTTGAGAPDPAKMPKGMPADLDAALRDVFEVFRRDLPKYEAGVNRAVKVPISQAQFDALVSFHYNTGAIGKASLVKRLNAGDFAGAATGFMAWKKPPEIIDRRKAEQALFAKGVYPGGQVTVWQVSKAGSVIWKPARRMNMPQVLALLRGGKAEAAAPAREIAAPVARPEPEAHSKARAGSAKVLVAVLAVVGGAAFAAWNWLLGLFTDAAMAVGNLFN